MRYWMADKFPCHACKKNVSKTKNDRYRMHTDGAGEPCEMSSVEIPEHILEAGPVDPKAPADVPVAGVDYAQCPQCTRKVQLTRLGCFEPHDETLRGGVRCPVSGVRYEHARTVKGVELPAAADTPGSATDPSADASNAGAIGWSKVGDLKYLPTSAKAVPATETSFPDELEGKAATEDEAEREWLALNAESGASTETSSRESPTTSTPSPAESAPDPATEPAVEPDGTAGEVLSLGVFLQPASPWIQPAAWMPVFLQPEEYQGPVKAQPMGDLAKQIATQVKETFYAYSNRKTKDNRSAQATLGPSEIGTPCDRRLAMSLLGVPPVNAGGDGWAAFVGTCTHAGMAEVYTFADAGTGRYAVELPVFLGVPTVPRGTTDLLDRRDATITDWKVMGKYSLDKFRKEGPSHTYRTQAHVYGLGAERSGEKVRNVAIVGLPRAGRSLDEMHVWTEKFDRKFAQAALGRVEKIANKVQAEEVERATHGGLDIQEHRMKIAREFPAADDCTFCEFHLKNDTEMRRGCPGR